MTLQPGMLVHAATLPLEHTPLPADQVLEGSPTTGWLELDTALGVWEMTPGTATDTEADEIFIVISGRATLTGAGPEPLLLEPGVVVRLRAGMECTWQVHETLRKVYLEG